MDNNVKLDINLENSQEQNPVMKFLKNVFKRSSSLEKTKARAGYVFVLPFILGILLIYLPILFDSIWFSFNDVNAVPGSTELSLEWRGLDHYKEAFANESFTVALLNGIQQLIFEVPAIIIFSLFIAVVLNQKMLGRAVFRAIFFVPVIISTGIMETINNADKMASGAGGGIDDGSGSTGASDIISVLDVEALFSSMKVGSELVMYVVDLVNNVYNIINYSGVQMLIFLAGLQSISPSIYEACRIDGATGWETFWKVTLPMISPIILVNAVYTIIDSFTRTTNPAMAYIDGIASKGDMEWATAMSWMYFIIVALILAVVAAIASSFVFYQRRD